MMPMQSEAEYCRLAEIDRLGGVGGYTGDDLAEDEPEPIGLRTMSRKARWQAYMEHRRENGKWALPFGEWLRRNW